MILDFDSYIINESSLKKLKRQVHGALDMKSREKMRRELRDNIVTFKFKKRNGEIRTAHGTLHPSYLPKLRGGAPRPEHQMVYYDLDKNSWRSFRSYSFIKILNIKPVEIKPIVPKPKPVAKEDEEEETKKVTMEKEKEEVKKPIHKEEDEKEVKKPVHKKEVEDVDEDGEKHAYKSPIYDESEDEKKERKEDDEKIEKLKHKDEDEPEEKDKKEKSEGE